MMCSFNLRRFRTFFGQKNWSQKFDKSKANPWQKCSILFNCGHFFSLFNESSIQLFPLIWDHACYSVETVEINFEK